MLAAATTYMLAFNPTDRLADPTSPCLWHAVFGIGGFTCGGYALAVWTAGWLTGRQPRLWVPDPASKASENPTWLAASWRAWSCVSRTASVDRPKAKAEGDVGRPPAARAAVVYGTADSIVPPEQSRTVAAKAAGPVTVTAVEGADHNDPELVDGPQVVAAVVRLVTSLA